MSMKDNPYENEYNENIVIEGDNNDTLKAKVKKNRTLQYYKLLFYSIKTEIKINDFLYILRSTNSLEMILWFLSIIIYANIYQNENNGYNYVFIWLHLLHLIRAFLGMYVGYKLPRSFHLTDNLDILDKVKLQRTLFNDIIREIVFNKIIIPIKELKGKIILYILFTILNYILDFIEFFVLLINIRNSSKKENKIIFISYFIIDLLYLYSNTTYFIWIGKLKFIFPDKYLNPIHDIFNGIIDKALVVFKLKKPKTDVISEERIQNNKNIPYKNTTQKNEMGTFEVFLKESLGTIQGSYSNNENVKQQGQNKKLPEYKLDKEEN